MTLVDLLEIVGLVAAITLVLWAIGRQGIDMGQVFATLFSHGAPDRRAARGLQEDDDAWEHIHAMASRPPTAPTTEDDAAPVPTRRARSSG